MKIYFCSFSNTEYDIKSLKRLEKQARRMRLFDDIKMYTEHDFDDNFRNAFCDKLNKDSRGFGYWVWKPYIISRQLKRMKTGDLMLYADAGCHLKRAGKKRISKYINIINNTKNGILLYQKDTKKYLEKYWTKGSLLEYFKVYTNNKILNSPQIIATSLLLIKNNYTIKFINDWLRVFYTDFSLIDDSESNIKNYEYFKENRHDQSVLSILGKINNVDLMSSSEIEGEEAVIKGYPIIAFRDVKNRMPYKKYCLLRLTRIIKNPKIYIQSFFPTEPRTRKYYDII